MKNKVKTYREMEEEIILFDATTIATGNDYEEIEEEINRREIAIQRQGVTTDPVVYPVPKTAAARGLNRTRAARGTALAPLI